MRGGIFNRSECCDVPCECPVCLENKTLMRLNCDHYICLEDTQNIIRSNPRRLQKCPICRTLITSYGCNGNIVNVGNQNQNQNQQPNIIPFDESDSEETIIQQATQNVNGYNIVSDDESSDEMYGGKHKKYSRRKRKTNKNKKRTNKRKTNKNKKRTNKRKSNKKTQK
jgi:hypothetical protein